MPPETVGPRNAVPPGPSSRDVSGGTVQPRTSTLWAAAGLTRERSASPVGEVALVDFGEKVGLSTIVGG